MKRTRRTPLALLAALLLCLSCAGASQAGVIVDTGPVSAGPGIPNWTLNYTQWLGSEFTVGGPTTITGVQAFVDSSQGGTLLAVLHADGGTTPGGQLFAQSFFVAPGAGTAPSPAGYDYGWFGVGGLSWTVGPGSYWITFETPEFGGYSGTMAGGASNPLEIDAHYDWTPRAWLPDPGYESLNLGIRIDGESAPPLGAVPVPEPGTLLLLGSGLVGLAGCRRAARK